MSKTQNKRTVGFLFGLWRIAPRRTVTIFTSMALATVLGNVIAPLFVSRLMGSVARGTATWHNSVWLLVAYIAFLVIDQVVLMRIAMILAYYAENKMQTRIAERVLDDQINKSMNFHGNHMSGGIVSDATKLNGSIERFWDMLFWNFTPIVAGMLGTCIALAFFVWQYAIVLFVLAVAISLFIIRAQSGIVRVTRRVAEKTSAITAHTADVISNINVVKAFVGGNHERTLHHQLLDDWNDELKQEMKRVVVVTGSFGTFLAGLNGVAIAAAILATQHHIASVGVVYLLITYTLNVSTQMWQVTNLVRMYNRVVGDAGPMIAMLNEPVEVTDPSTPEPVRIGAGAVDFTDVTFAHTDANDAIFSKLNLAIKPGEKIGLVGHSGSGKTTLTRLLLRFSDVDGGAITIDGQNIAAITQDDLRAHIAYVPQEPLLFHRSVFENIAYGKADATLEEVRAAARGAYAADFIETLPHGYDTIVGERGVKLSGGQRQRIAIARAMIKDAPILILDEATSALDSESEALIQDALWTLMQGRTAIVIAHRLSTIHKMDRIVVLDDGKIIEQGTHKQLITKKTGIYAGLWKRQSGGFLEED